MDGIGKFDGRVFGFEFGYLDGLRIGTVGCWNVWTVGTLGSAEEDGEECSVH